MIEGKAVLHFGTGDILITPMVTKEGRGKLFFQGGRGTGVIGEYSSTDSFHIEGTDTLFTFSKVESIDVIIERLEMLKKMMLGDLTDCVEYTEDNLKLEE